MAAVPYRRMKGLVKHYAAEDDVNIDPIARPELVPGAVGIGALLNNEEINNHVQWIGQKIALHQAPLGSLFLYPFLNESKQSSMIMPDKLVLKTYCVHPLQDICLLGGYGPLRRWIALRYCRLHQREVTKGETWGQSVAQSYSSLPLRSQK